MGKSIESQPKIKCDELIDRLNEVLSEANFLESRYAVNDFTFFESSIARLKSYVRWVIEDLKEIK